MTTEESVKRIGISVVFQHSFFSNGQSTVALALAETMKALGHSVVFVNINGTVPWWDDCTSLKDSYEVRHLTEWESKGYAPLDIFIDIDGYLVPQHRRSVAKQIVVFVRKPTAVNEMESSIYPIQQPIRNLRDCDAVWTWAHFGRQDIHILELLSSKPVFGVPFVWSPLAVDAHSAGMSTWIKTALDAEESMKNLPWSAHIAETNTSMCSNLTLPIVIVSKAKTQNKAPMMEYMVHNGQSIEKQQFFQENVNNHCKVPELRTLFCGRQRVSDWKLQPKSCVVSHTRFNTVKGLHLDAAWNGIPVIHNSPVLRDIGHGLERLYYTDNSVMEATAAIGAMNDDFVARQGIFAEGALDEIRATIRERFSIRSGTAGAKAYSTAINCQVVQTPVVVAEPLAVAPVAAAKKKVLRVGFSDLWQDANTDYNFWTLLLTEACRQLKESVEVKSCTVTEANAATAEIDVLFFGPFSEVYKKVPDAVPKIHITGENTASVFGHGVFLNLGFDETDEDRGVYRFPLWKQYLDWFGANQERLINPKTMPLDSVVRVDKEVLLAKKKFCAFVVSNPTNPVRNAAFQWLSQYKKVDSAGRLFNNIGEDIFTVTGGGGGGELKKLEFLKDYKFCLTYENGRRDGYVTEKLLAAKAAGCVPIYWGANNVCDDFAEGSFLNANSFSSPDELISAVRALDEDEEAWLAMASKPAFSVDAVRRELAHITRLIVSKVLGMDVAVHIPEMLGGGTSEEAAALGMAREGTVVAAAIDATVGEAVTDVQYLTAPSTQVKWNGRTLLVTFATQRFLQSLLQWLNTSTMRTKSDPSIQIRVYLGDDVDTIQQNLLKSQYPDIEVRRVPSKTLKVAGFDDLWEPQHFAWKLWIYQELVREAELEGTLVWYMDAGSIIVRWPEKWLSIAARAGLCMLEDKEQKNEQWCHAEFCKRLAVTAAELAAQQVVGGIMAFVCGAELPWKVFCEAWKYGQVREIIVGPKWAGIRPDGRPYGHRHDQSILSLLRVRHNVPVEPLDTVYNHESLRRTAKSGACLYVHRGHIKEHINFAPRIGEVHLINLARRPDRIKRFKENHGAWTKEVCLRPAFDGKQLALSPALARLFAPNDFFWKKAVMGCALSHLSLWLELASEPAACENYLVLEDDVKFSPDWLARWEEAAKDIPADYDVLYLGGVLPPNRAGYESLVEPVSEYWARVHENQMFGQPKPTRYFHFCNYAYILSRRGAQKILQGLAKAGGYYTSADHMICNRVEDMNHYMLNPLVAGCYQDEDPKYAQSQFNDFSRVDNFDSDLWNNNDRFAESEIRGAIGAWNDKDLPSLLGMALTDGRKVAASKEEVLTEVDNTTVTHKKQFYTVGTHTIVPSALLEYSWLREVCGDGLDTITNVEVEHAPIETHPVFILMKPYFAEYALVFARYEAMGVPFSVLHLSDEETSDPISWIQYAVCKQVIRIYPHPTLVNHPKVTVLPLGPNRRCTSDAPGLKERKTIWSFFGTGWQQRAEKLAPWAQLEPFKAKFYERWADSNQLTATEYSQVCADSVFMLCPGGMNPETFRFYEALDHGAIPVYVRCEGDETYWAMLTKHLPLREYGTWDEALKDSVVMLQNPAELSMYRGALLNAWAVWKAQIQTTLTAFLVSKA